MVKLEVLKMMFNDLSIQNKLLFEDWVKKELLAALINRKGQQENV